MMGIEDGIWYQYLLIDTKTDVQIRLTGSFKLEVKQMAEKICNSEGFKHFDMQEVPKEDLI